MAVDRSAYRSTFLAFPVANFTISRNASLPFERDGRRKLYDRPPANDPLSRYYKSFRFATPHVPAPELLDGKLKENECLRRDGGSATCHSLEVIAISIMVTSSYRQCF